MSPQRTELGHFAKLPPELRLCIWDWLLPYADTERYPGKELPWPRPNTSLTILRTSWRLHDEISHHLYSNLTVSFTIDPLESVWTYCRLPKFTLRFTIGCMGRAFYRGLNNFPFHRVPVRVDILPPKPSSPGQLILLFERLQVLVDFLSMAKSIKTVDIHFRHAADKRRKWHKQGKPLRSLTYAPWFEYEFMDHQIATLPFCRLHNVSSKTLYYSKTCARALDWTIPARAGVCYRRDGDQTIDEFDDIDLFFSKLNDCFVYRVENGLPGEAARELRYQLERWVKAGMQKDTVKFDIYFLPLPLSSYPPVSKIKGLVQTAERQHPWRHPQYGIIAVGRHVEFYKWDAAKSVPVLYTGMYDLLAQSATIHERLMKIREERLAGRQSSRGTNRG